MTPWPVRGRERQGRSAHASCRGSDDPGAERTFTAWLRTGLAFLGGGLAAQHYLRDVVPPWPLKLLGIVLVACALLCFAASGWQDWRVRRRLPEADIRFLPRLLTGGVAAVLSATAALSGLTLWLG